MEPKSKLHNELQDQPLKITPLGAGNEVGRSCVIVDYKNCRIMLDCGIHPAHKGIAALPYFDEIQPASIDMILITHFHLDHSAALPYFLAKTDFRGRVFMTHPTKSIYQLLLQDYIRVSAVANPDPLFDEIDLNNSMERIETIDFHQVTNVKGVKFWAYHAGHVLGAAMFMIEIAGVKILYTGDYSRKDDRHLAGAEMPEEKPDVLIIESTYGIQRLEPIQTREKKFTDLVQEVLLRGGRCLIPVFALGRAQELLLILDEYWRDNPQLHSYPVYYASSLARKCMAVYQTYINMMNSKVQKEFETRNPFLFDHIRFLKGSEDFHDVGPAVVFASPGMLQSGFSRKLFEEWCGDARNGVIIPGYIVEGTMAKSIMLEPKEIDSWRGGSLPLKMSIHYVTFSAHADFNETSDFIETLDPPHIILVHGDCNEMSRLNKALSIQLRDKKTQISTPKNCQTVELGFGSEKIAKVVGTLAQQEFQPGNNVDGVLVLKDYAMSIMDKKELAKFTPLACSSIFQSIKVPFRHTFGILTSIISDVFSIELEEERSGFHQMTVSHNVRLLQNAKKGFVLVEWHSSPVADAIADSSIMLISNAEMMSRDKIANLMGSDVTESNPLKRKKQNQQLLLENTEKVLRACFGGNKVVKNENDSFEIEFDDCKAVVDSELRVECPDERAKGMVRDIIETCGAAYSKIDINSISSGVKMDVFKKNDRIEK